MGELFLKVGGINAQNLVVGYGRKYHRKEAHWWGLAGMQEAKGKENASLRKECSNGVSAIFSPYPTVGVGRTNHVRRCGGKQDIDRKCREV